MRLATIITSNGTRAVRIVNDRAIETAFPDVGTLLRQPDWPTLAPEANGQTHDRAEIDYAPVVPRPRKIICVGINYATHISEMGRDMPEHPTLFAKYPEALIGAYDEITLPANSEAMDWEAELAVVLGAPVRHADAEKAEAAIAGYSVINDVTARDWQYRTLQWLQGKTFEATCPFGPELVTPDEAGTANQLTCLLDGETTRPAGRGSARTACPTFSDSTAVPASS